MDTFGIILDISLAIIGILFLYFLNKLLSKGKRRRTATSSSNDDEDLSKEDSEADGLMGEGDIMFPPEDLDSEDD